VDNQALEPCQLVLELRAGLRIPVREIDAADQHAIHCGLDISALLVLRIARQQRPGQHRLGIPCKDGHAVPRLPFSPDAAVAKLNKLVCRKGPISALQLLQTNHVRLSSPQPSQKVWQPPIDVVDVEGGDLH
jgi:hypothetical protein